MGKIHNVFAVRDAVPIVGMTLERQLLECGAPLQDSSETLGPNIPVRQHHDTLIQSDLSYHWDTKVDPCILGGQRTGERGGLVKATNDDVLVLGAACSRLPPNFDTSWR